MKRSILAFIFVLLCIICLGCSNSNSSDNNEAYNPYDGSKKVSTEQILRDLPLNNNIQNCFTSDFVYPSNYEIINFTTTKRQTNLDDKEDIIYAEVEAENNYFHVFLDTKLIYNFYDEGGWILDNAIVNVTHVYPIAPAEPELALANICPERDSYYDRYHVHFLDDINGFVRITEQSASIDDVILTADKAYFYDYEGYETVYYFTLENEIISVTCWDKLEFTSRGWEKVTTYFSNFDKYCGNDCFYANSSSITWNYDINSLEKDYYRYGNAVSMIADYNDYIELIKIYNIDKEQFTLTYYARDAKDPNTFGELITKPYVKTVPFNPFTLLVDLGAGDDLEYNMDSESFDGYMTKEDFLKSGYSIPDGLN